MDNVERKEDADWVKRNYGDEGWWNKTEESTRKS